MEFAAVSKLITSDMLNFIQAADIGYIDLNFEGSNEPFKDAAKAIREMSFDSKYSVVKRLALQFPATEENSKLETFTNEPSETSEIGSGLRGITDLIILYGPFQTHENVESRFDRKMVTGYWAGLMQHMPNVTTLKCNGSVPRVVCLAETAPRVGTRHPIRFCNTNKEVAEAFCDVYLNPILPDDLSSFQTTIVEILKGFNPDKDLDINGTLINLARKVSGTGQLKKTLEHIKRSVLPKYV